MPPSERVGVGKAILNVFQQTANMSTMSNQQGGGSARPGVGARRTNKSWVSASSSGGSSAARGPKERRRQLQTVHSQGMESPGGSE